MGCWTTASPQVLSNLNYSLGAWTCSKCAELPKVSKVSWETDGIGSTCLLCPRVSVLCWDWKYLSSVAGTASDFLGDPENKNSRTKCPRNTASFLWQEPKQVLVNCWTTNPCAALFVPKCSGMRAILSSCCSLSLEQSPVFSPCF